MAIISKDQAYAELLHTADLIAELEKKRLRLVNEGRPLRDLHEEIEYGYTIEVEKTGESRLRALFNDPYRKELEIRHRLRTDSRAMGFAVRLDKIESEIDELDSQLNRLDSRRLVLERIAGISYSPEPEEDGDEDLP